MDICRDTEVSEEQLKSLHKEPMIAVAAHVVSRKRLSGKLKKLHAQVNRKQNVNSSSASHTNQISCNKCGKQHEKGKCFAYNQTCYECRGRHHFAQYCTRRRRKTNVHSVEEGRDLFLGIVSVDSVQDSPWTEKLTINNIPVTFKLDTGAQANIIPRNVFNTLQISQKNLQKVKVNLITYNGNVMNPDGKIDIRFKFVTRTVHFLFM